MNSFQHFHKNFYVENVDESDKSKCPHKLPTFTFLDAILVFILTIFSFLTYFLLIYIPDRIVYDEVYVGNFSKFYNRGEYFFDINPPLGKLILGLAGHLAEMDVNFSYAENGDAFSSLDYITMRSTNAFFGALKSPLLYITARICGVSPSWAFVCGFMPAVDNGFITQSRHIFIDGILTFFVTLSITSIAYAATEESFWGATIFVGISCALAACTKFTAGGLYIAVAIAYFKHFSFVKTVIAGCIIVFIFLVVLFTTFGLHFYFLPHPGDGCQYHEEGYCDHLENFSVIPDTINLIKLMINETINDDNYDCEEMSRSKWYQWPFMAYHGVYMYNDVEFEYGQIWCIGTPTVWYSGLIGLITFIVFFFKRNKKVVQYSWLIGGYLASYLPLSLFSRQLYNSHYLIPLLFNFVMFSITGNIRHGDSWLFPIVICIIQFATYIYFAPVTYDFITTLEKINDRFWFL